MDVVHFLSFALLITVIWSAAFFSLPIIVWTLLVGLTLLVITLFSHLAIVTLIILWLIFLSVALICNLHTLRQQYLILPLLSKLRRQLPAISTTEREAIEAGNTWWEKELFCGRPQWKKLFQIPTPTLNEEEKKFLNHQVETVCSMIDDWQIVHNDHDLSPEVWEYLKKEKFFGLVIPKKYEGLGFSALAHSTVVVKIATRSVSAAVNTMVPNSLGPAELLLHYGTEDQKNFYLPRLARGEEIPCFALTSPEAGSDAGSIPDNGIVCRDSFNGKEVLGIRVSWDKRYITLAPIATVLGLAIHLYDPDHLIGDKNDVGITLCLIPTSHPGVKIGNRHFPLHLAFMNGPTRGENVFIPLEWIIGGPEMAGQGWRMLMECLSIGRSISLPALSTACGKMTYRYTGAYARIRRQFNTSISAFEGIEEALSHIAGFTYILESARLMTAGAVDLKIKPSIASAIAKYHMTELARHVISDAMDIHAGHMIQTGPRNFLANVYLAVPISITVEGANILTRNLIIFGQGAIRCHPFLLKEIELITAPTCDTRSLDKVMMSHVGFFVSNLLRNIAYGVTGGAFIFTNIKNKRIKKYERQLTRMSAALALFADTSLILLGGSLKRRERISARLGDILSELYLASAVLKYFHDNNYPESDVDYVCWTLEYFLNKIQRASDELLNNFPYPILGRLLRFIVFPFGSPYFPVSDFLSKKIVNAMLSSSELRERLTKYCYIGTNENELIHRLDKALLQVDANDPILKKIHKAIQSNLISSQLSFVDQVEAAQHAGIITVDETHSILKYDHLKSEIIKVNEFSFDFEKVIA